MIISKKRIIENPIDFLLLYLYQKENGELITTLMKIFQILTSFSRFKHLDNFKPSFYGGEDTQLENAIYSSSHYFPIEYSGENDKIKRISLNKTIREDLDEKISEIININQQSKKDFELIQKLALISNQFKQAEIIKFCYYFWSDKTQKSTIIEDIAKINDILLRKVLNFFLLSIPTMDALEFINLNHKKIYELSFLSPNNQKKLGVIVKNLIKSNEIKEILKSSKNIFTELLENVSDSTYKQILRKSVNLLVFNEEAMLNDNFMLDWLVLLLKLRIEYKKQDFTHFIKILSDYSLEYSINSISIN